MVTDPRAAVSPAADATPAVSGRFPLQSYSSAKALGCDRTPTAPATDLVSAPGRGWRWS